MAQIESGGGGHGKHDKKRAKKLSTRIDMTPMVDLAFLLLTFFVLTSTFSKPKVLRMIFPEKVDKDQPIEDRKVKDGLTLILNGSDKVYFYSGSTATADTLGVTDFSKNGLRDILKKRNVWLLNELAKIQKESDRGPKNDTAFERKIREKLEKAQYDSKFVVLVKHAPEASYKNMIDVVDEFLITQVAKYFVVDEPLAKKEQEMLDKKTGK